MNGWELPASIQEVAHLILTWVGFGTLVGLLAKAIMPGRDPGGAIANLLMGVGGTVIGCGLLMFVSDGRKVTPISPEGFLVATGGAFILLFFYRLLGGQFFVEGEFRAPRFRRRRARRPSTEYEYELGD
jgi:uncharacterized membrane protein YeaQ/YmgE (transglycosylase-associated protein family)